MNRYRRAKSDERGNNHEHQHPRPLIDIMVIVLCFALKRKEKMDKNGKKLDKRRKMLFDVMSRMPYQLNIFNKGYESQEKSHHFSPYRRGVRDARRCEYSARKPQLG